MGVLSKLFGSDKVIDAGIAGIDKAFYTEEEKADDSFRRAKFKMAFLKLYEPFKLAQRFMMLVVGISYVGTHIAIVITWLICIFLFIGNSEIYDFIVNELKQLGALNNETLGVSFSMIVGFYFGGGMLEGAISKYASVKATK